MNFEDLRTAVNIMDKLIVDCIVFFILLALVFSMFVTDMQKREWCYAYIRYDACFCQNDPDVLINRSLAVNPYKVDNYLSLMNEEQRKEFEEKWILPK